MKEVRIIIIDETLTLRVNANILLKDLLLKIAQHRALNKRPAVRHMCTQHNGPLRRMDLNCTLENLGINEAKNVLYGDIKASEKLKYNLSPELLEERVQNLSRRQEEALMVQAEAFSNKFPLSVFQILLAYASNEPEALNALLGAQHRVSAYYADQLARLENLSCSSEEEQSRCLPPSEMHLRSLMPLLPEAKKNPDQLLAKAIADNDIWLLNLTLRCRANPDLALLIAAEQGRETIVRLLLALPGIDVNYVDARGTALLRAVTYNHLAIVHLLLAAPGIDVNGVEMLFSETALLSASCLGSQAIVTALLAAPGIDVNRVETRNGHTALLLAAKLGYEAIVVALLAVLGIDVNHANRYGETALLLASRNGHVAIVAALLAVPGIDVSHVDSFGETALLLASKNGHVAIVTALRVFLLNESKPREAKKLNSFSLLALKQPSKAAELPEKITVLNDAILSASRCRQRLIEGKFHVEIHLDGATLQKKLELRNHFESFFDQIFLDNEEDRPHADVAMQKQILTISGITLEALKKLLEIPRSESRCSIS